MYKVTFFGKLNAMKVVSRFFDEIEANLAKDRLISLGIEARVIGAKEYTSHVLGGGAGRYDLFVPDEDYERAVENLPKLNVVSEDHEPLIPDHFRRAVFYGLAGAVFLPGVFNVASLINAQLYWRHSQKDSTAVRNLFLIGLCQIPGLLVGILEFRAVFN